MNNAAQLTITDSQISDPTVEGDLEAIIKRVLTAGPEALILKRGEEGAATYLPEGEVIEATPFTVDVCNILGAGDAFAAGFIYGYLRGWSWEKAGRMGNATGAIVVTRQGCANFMPYEAEALEFIESQGGF
jgi:5-dehydro-2-deoxygluconokinase